MEIYNFKEETSSLLKVDARLLAAFPYLVLVIFRLINSISFIGNIFAYSKYGLFETLAAYSSIYITWIDLFIAFIPLIYIIFEKNSKLMKYHAWQYLIINLFIPLIYIILFFIVFAFMGFFNVPWESAMDFLYFVMLLYGIYAAVMCILQVMAIFSIINRRSNKFLLISKLALKFSKVL